MDPCTRSGPQQSPPEVPPEAGPCFDFSGTLFRLEEDASWFGGMTIAEQREVDRHVQVELMRLVLVDPLPSGQRPDGLRTALRDHGLRV